MSDYNTRPHGVVVPIRRRPARTCEGCGIAIHSGAPLCLECRRWREMRRHVSATYQF